MTNNNFDKEMADILKGMKVPYDAMSWHRLEKKLKEEDGDDAVFDRVIAEKLKAFSVPATGASFEKLQAKMDSNHSGKSKSNNYNRLMGVAAAILLLISGFLLFNNDDTGDILTRKSVAIINNSSSAKQSKSPVDFDELKKANLREANDNDIENNLNVIAESVSSKTINHKGNSNLSKPELSSRYIGDNIYQADNDSDFTPNYGLTLAGLENNTLRNHFFKGNVYRLNNQIEEFTLTIDIEFNNQLALDDSGHYVRDNSDRRTEEFGNGKNNNIVEAEETINKDIAANSFTEVDSTNSSYNTNTGFDILPEVNTNEARKRSMFVKATIIPTVNYIDTPNDNILKIPGYSQVKKGFGAGLALSYKNQKHEIESGVDVVSLSYSPKKVVLENNQSSFYLDKIEYLKIRIPLVYKYHIVENKNWDFYSIAGISANAALNSNYSFVEKSVDDQGNTHSLSHFAKDLQNNSDFQNTLYYKKNYNKGIRDGARIKDNLFVSANAGLGIRKKFKNGLSITFEPQYNYIFKGLGPNDDTISSLEFKLGISKAINL